MIILMILAWILLSLVLGVTLSLKVKDQVEKQTIASRKYCGISYHVVTEGYLKPLGGACCIWDKIFVEESVECGFVLAHEHNHKRFYHGVLTPIFNRSGTAGIYVLVAFALFVPLSLTIIAGILGYFVVGRLRKFVSHDFEYIADKHMTAEQRGEMKAHLQSLEPNEVFVNRISALEAA